MRVNTEARLRALKIGLLVLAGLGLLAIIPAEGCRTTFPEKSRANSLQQSEQDRADLLAPQL